MIVEMYWKSGLKEIRLWPSKLGGTVIRGEPPVAILLKGFHGQERIDAIKTAKKKVHPEYGYVGEVV